MLKSLWTAVSSLAVVHLLVLVFLGVWLIDTGRLSRERLHAIRELLSQPTQSERETLLRAARPESESPRVVAGDAGGPAQTDLTESGSLPADSFFSSAQQIRFQNQNRQTEHDLVRRLRKVTDDLRGQLEMERAALSAERNEFEEERRSWEEERKLLAAATSDAQFQRVVTLLETVPARHAKDTLIELAAGGETGQAVAYLNAMTPFSASRILREFRADAEKQLAAELLQRMRLIDGGAALPAAGGRDARTPPLSAGEVLPGDGSGHDSG